MTAARIIGLICAKMALADGRVVETEDEFLRPLLESGEDLDSALLEAREAQLSVLVSNLDNYADRFYVALRAFSVSRVDSHLHPAEQSLYQELLGHLMLQESDLRVIQDTADPEKAPSPRIMELYLQSSLMPLMNRSKP